MPLFGIIARGRTVHHAVSMWNSGESGFPSLPWGRRGCPPRQKAPSGFLLVKTGRGPYYFSVPVCEFSAGPPRLLDRVDDGERRPSYNDR